MTDAGLYLHFPFCSGKCKYCDFYSAEFDNRIKQKYATALCEQLKVYGERLRLHFDTLYLGGGTPTTVSAELLCDVITAAKKYFGDFSEITVEANPGDDLFDTFKSLHSVGVNRISLGLQSANDDELLRLGRRHNAAAAKKCVEDARKAGIKNISVDLMLGIPGQTSESLAKTVDYILSLSPEHISAYMLKIEPNTPFGKADEASLCLPDDDETAQMYLCLCDRLAKSGYRHYEISNFCKPGCESRHNLKYWTLAPYLGIGPGAHSFINGERFFYPRDINAFLKSPETVSDGKGGGAKEYIMLSLRTDNGLDYDHYSKNYGADFRVDNDKFISQLQKNGLAQRQDDALALTEKGFLLSNSIISKLI